MPVVHLLKIWRNAGTIGTDARETQHPRVLYNRGQSMSNVEDLGILSGTDQLNCALMAGRDNALEGLWMSRTDEVMLQSFYVWNVTHLTLFSLCAVSIGISCPAPSSAGVILKA